MSTCPFYLYIKETTMTAIVKIEKTPRKNNSTCVTPKTAPKTAGKLDSFAVFFFCYCAEFSNLLDCLCSFE
jgi:hypothetical protein